MHDKTLRESIIHAARAMHVDRLTVANSGNISARNDLGFLITPSGVAYESLQPADIVQLDIHGNQIGGELIPSSEWKIHADIYQHRAEVNAVVHAHSPAATALSALRKPVPAFHYMVALIGGTQIPCAEYATFGTQALSDNILKAMEGFKACLMSNHGMLAVGASLSGAYGLALELESLCAQYSLAKQTGDVVLLTDAEMAEAKAAFAVYGQKKQGLQSTLK
jgi:L-fuculose-phosphate aldolase